MVLIVASCSDFDEINTNPDASTKVPPQFLATELILTSTSSPNGKNLLQDNWLMKQSQFTEGAIGLVYNLIGTSDFEDYRSVIDAKKMVEIAENDNTMSEGELNTYKGLAAFFEASVLYDASMKLGDVPASEAFKGEEGLFTAGYDAQEDVFATILSLLESAADHFSKGEEIDADPIYNGKVELWERMVNSYMLRVLNMLSAKTTVKGINVQQKFEEVAQRNLIDSEDNSFQRSYSDKITAQYYPFNKNNNNFYIYPVMSSFIVDMLKKYQDYRLFYYADPAEALKANGEDSFDAYSGVDPVADFSVVVSESNAGLHSTFNDRYHLKPDGEPIKFVAYSETQFILAEAALRGWSTPEMVEAHYANAIKAAMEFTAKHTSAEYSHGVTIDQAYINTYLSGEASLSNAGNNNEKLKMIMEQKYIASFIQLRWNSFFDYRRTGLPELPINPATNLNPVPDKMPSRWRYTDSEYSENKEAVEEALKRQFGGVDSNNELMWLLK